MLEGYYFITDEKLSRAGIYRDVKNALLAGVKVVQYRNKNASTKQMYEEAEKLRAICKNITFLVNDRLDIALAVKADGVHIGASDLPFKTARKLLGKDKIIGLTVHNVKEAKQAQALGADYIGVAPVFATQTKKDISSPVGIEMIKKIKSQVNIPIIAIGGINLSNAKDVVEAGANGLAAISAVVSKKNVQKEIRRFQAVFKWKLLAFKL